MRTAALIAILALAACAPSTPPGRQALGPDGLPRPCFHADHVNGFHDVDRDTVDLTVSSNEVYRVELFGACPDIDSVHALAVRTRGGSSWICEGAADLEVVVQATPVGPQRCQARSIRRLTAAEIEAARRR
jgi:hypothetical protein